AHPLQQRKVPMHVEALRLEAGETVRDGLEPFADGIEMIEALLQAEVAQVVGTEFMAQEAGEFLVLFQKRVFPVSPEDVMAMLDLIDHSGELPPQSFVQPDAEDLADPVGRQPPQTYLATALEDLVDGEVAFENEVPAVLDLCDRIEPRQAHLAAFLLGELRAEDEGPVIELFADDLRAEPVGGGLQRGDIAHRKEGVIVFAEGDVVPLQFLLHERVAVEPVRGVEWKERCHADDDRPEALIADIEVVMGEAAGLMRQDAVVGILRGILRHADSERPALFHALEDKVDSTGILFHHPSQRGQHVIFLANTFSCPLNRDLMVAGESLHPVLVIVRALAESFLAHHQNAEDLAPEMHHLFGPGQPAEVTVDDNAVETVIYKNEQAAKQLSKPFHGNHSTMAGLRRGPENNQTGSRQKSGGGQGFSPRRGD